MTTSRTPTLAEVIRIALDNRLAEVHIMLPGKIDSYDPKTQKANVKPMIRRLQEAENGKAIEESLPIITSVPVAWPRAGGFKGTMPVNKGDRCTLQFSEASIDNYQASQSDDEVDPEVFERFNLTDAIVRMEWYQDANTLEETDSDDMVIGKDGGEVIHIGGGEVNLFEKDAADFVALSQKTFDEIDALKVTVGSLVDTFNLHIHTTTATIGTAGPGVIAPTLTPATSPATVNSVAAEKVKAT